MVEPGPQCPLSRLDLLVRPVGVTFQGRFDCHLDDYRRIHAAGWYIKLEMAFFWSSRVRQSGVLRHAGRGIR